MHWFFWGGEPTNKEESQRILSRHNDFDFEVLLRSSTGALIVCSGRAHSRRKGLVCYFLIIIILFLSFTKGSRIMWCLQRLHVSTRKKKTTFPFLLYLMINVIILLDMVWFGFLIFNHDDDDDDAFRSFLRCLCHIGVCVAISEVHHFICNKLSRVGWIDVEQQIFLFLLFFCFPQVILKSKAHAFVVKFKRMV